MTCAAYQFVNQPSVYSRTFQLVQHYYMSHGWLSSFFEIETMTFTKCGAEEKHEE
jgi:hypothetical protein